MLQQITIQTPDAQQFMQLLKTALEREAKLLDYAIERTHQALAPFESRYGMTSDDFERKFQAHEVEESLDFLDWWMEVEALRHLESQRQSLNNAKLNK